MIKILTVCLGNICRSPAAEEILRAKLLEAGWEEGVDFELDSAGTGSWHVGGAPDVRSQEVCAPYGVDISGLVARQLQREDGEAYDFLLGMDQSNLDNIKTLIDREQHEKVHLFDRVEVHDPYYSASDGFEIMYQQLEVAAERWVAEFFKTDV